MIKNPEALTVTHSLLHSNNTFANETGVLISEFSAS